MRCKRRLSLYFLAITFLTSPLSAQAFSISVVVGELTFFRLFLFLTMIFCIIENRGIVIVYRKKNRFPVLVMGMMVLYAAVSVIWSINLSNWFRMFYFLLVALLLLVLSITICRTIDELRLAMEGLQWGVLIQSVIGWYEIFTRDYRYLKLSQGNIYTYIHSESRIPVAMLGNPNDFASLLYLGFSIALILFFLKKKRGSKIYQVLIMVNFMIQIYLSGSRANMIGIVLLLFAFFALKYQAFKVLGVLFGVLFSIPLCSIIKSILASSTSPNGSNNIRFALMKNGLGFLVDTAGIGVGAGQIEVWMEKFGRNNTYGIFNIHNWWLEILVSFGIVIFLMYLWMYLKMIKNLVKQFREGKKERDNKNLAIALIASMVGFIVASISSSSNMYAEWIWSFWAIVIVLYGHTFKINESLIQSN